MKVVQENGRANEATSKLNEATWRSYRALLDGAFAVQEQYMKLALNGVGPVEMYKNQAEISRYVMETVAEQSQKQWEAFQALVEESLKVYMDLFYASVPYAPSFSYRDRGVPEKNSELPIEDYDRLSVERISRRLRDLSAYEVEELKAYEQRHKNRATLIERFDRSLV